MVMVVADAILEAGWRSRGLNTPDQTFGDENAQGVVDGLERDCTNLRPDGLRHGVGRDVRLPRYRPEDSQSLGSNLDAALPKKISRIRSHVR
jgi:hypothetical protein